MEYASRGTASRGQSNFITLSAEVGQWAEILSGRLRRDSTAPAVQRCSRLPSTCLQPCSSWTIPPAHHAAGFNSSVQLSSACLVLLQPSTWGVWWAVLALSLLWAHGHPLCHLLPCHLAIALVMAGAEGSESILLHRAHARGSKNCWDMPDELLLPPLHKDLSSSTTSTTGVYRECIHLPCLC